MVLIYIVLALLPIAAVGYIVWDHKRKAAQREAMSAGRMEELLGIAQQAARGGAIEPSLAPTPREPAPPPVTFVLRERFLSPPQTLLYYLLKTGLPDYLVVAQVPVASLLDPAPNLAAYAREEQARTFARHTVDFAILDKSTRPVAAVVMGGPADPARGAASQMKAWLTTVGLRYIELDAAQLPRKEAVRALVLGAEAASVTT
ncbi:MAG TPA: DUF2726 domain-containing protein [Burkholderiales bacterium]|nr:DUF2726 domain-containing protein [Burkholderiales bacterium]